MVECTTQGFFFFPILMIALHGVFQSNQDRGIFISIVFIHIAIVFEAY